MQFAVFVASWVLRTFDIYFWWMNQNLNRALVLALCFVTLFGPYYCYDNPASTLNAVRSTSRMLRLFAAFKIAWLEAVVPVFPCFKFTFYCSRLRFS